ncbi:MAG TPA: hypothetical protein VJ742_12660 [Nitrososphaera sp.]|nr:hypothetical protein [Nitrososphaera sp.]
MASSYRVTSSRDPFSKRVLIDKNDLLNALRGLRSDGLLTIDDAIKAVEVIGEGSDTVHTI